MKRKPIYIEQEMAVTMTDLLRHMQEADKQSTWDMRLASLHYLPQTQHDLDEYVTERQFVFTTRLGFGYTIEGEGVCTTEYNPLKESVTSRANFHARAATTLLDEGNSYQKAQPTTEGVRFSTSFDYSVRFGWLGKLFDRLVIRPYVKWATRYSVDALRMWMRHGIHPRRSWRRSRLQALLYLLTALLAVAFIVTIQSPDATLDIALLLAAVLTGAWINSAELPRARNCRTKPSDGDA